MNRIPVRRALISVYDKRGLAEFASRLVAAGVELVSSGGTAVALTDAGLPVTSVESVTGSPEMLGGRVKTLHPRVHAGILADLADERHLQDLATLDIETFQLVVINLYPFESAANRPGVTVGEAIEKIDIGGPTLIRAAAKNHAWVGVVVSSDQYEDVAASIESGGLDAPTRLELARAAFYRTAAYDAAIVRWFARDDPLPDRLVLPLERTQTLRYGENPHQEAALYTERFGLGWWNAARQLQGKEMSFNNYADTEAAWRLAGELAGPAAVIVKHTNPCGAAAAGTLSEAFTAAWECDPLSAFGGVVAVNRPLDADTAELIAGHFVEVVIAPSVADGALDALAGKKSLRILEAPPPEGSDLDYRRVEDGFLVQARDTMDPAAAGGLPEGWRVVSTILPTADQIADLRFAWVVSAHTKSNAVVIAGGRAAVGVGAGDQSRVGAAERAVAHAGDRARGAVAASDAFFPFRDGLDTLANAGVMAVVEPGGSRRDDEVIEAADERGVVLLFTGERHFRH